MSNSQTRLQAITACVALTALFGLTGCSTTVPAEPAPSEGSARRQGSTSLTVGAPSLVGYQHAANASHFALGSSPVQRSEFGMSKLVGSYGVFATVTATGMTLGVSNADSPARARPPLTTDASAHNAAVLAYFTQAGIPSAQVARVSEQAAMQGGGREGVDQGTPVMALDFYFSTLSRQTPTGVAISDSYAWARINQDGDVVMESVFWPEIPVTVLKDADALSSVVSNPTAKAAFLAKLPHDTDGAFAQGSVSIRHTSGSWPGPFEARASYDVHHKAGRVVHYDSTGASFEFAEEAKDAWGPVATGTR